MQVIPAPLEKSSEDLYQQIKKLSPYFKRFQVDIADGIFVPNRTVQIEDISAAMKQWDNKILSGLTFDFHLMVKDYESEIKKLTKLRKSMIIKNVFIHFSLLPNYQLLATTYPQFSFGLVLNPEDSVENLTKRYTLNALPYIQIMSVTPGFQGSPFIPETLLKFKKLREKKYQGDLFLDGAINKDTLPTIKSLQFQPDYLCIGSFLTKSPDLQKSLSDLKL